MALLLDGKIDTHTQLFSNKQMPYVNQITDFALHGSATLS